MNRATLRRGHGALLLALLIAIALAFILMYGNLTGGGSYTQQVAKTRESGRQMALQVNGKQIATLVAIYRQENNKLPVSATDMEAPPATFNDQWGRPVHLSYEGDSKIIITSDGPDGEPSTEDDLRVVEPIPY